MINKYLQQIKNWLEKNDKNYTHAYSIISQILSKKKTQKMGFFFDDDDEDVLFVKKNKLFRFFVFKGFKQKKQNKPLLE